MERMNYINRPKPAYTQEEWIKYLEESIRELRKEKENLKKEKGEVRQRLVALEKNLETLSRVKENKELREENKKLNVKVASLEGEIKGLNYTIERLKEENQTLELWLDNKEKLNEEYRKEIDLLKCQTLGPSELADSLYDANKTIENLKEELSKYKKQYQHSMGFMEEDTLQELKDIGELEDDELIYEEGLYN